jgi:putative acyl-CoA dehydrogenase
MASPFSSPDSRTHEVTNQPPPLADFNLFETDRCLVEAVQREGAGWAEARLRDQGAVLGSAETIELGHLANRHVPLLRSHDRFGHRVDEVEFHPAWHRLMAIGMAAEQHALPWNDPRPGAHVARAALGFMMCQVESGVCCPLTMTFAAVPALRHQPEVAAEWEPRVRATQYDQRWQPAERKTAATIGMAMTEKQGGSDVRANSTRAEPAGAGGPGGEYLLTGHKWFCSAPMSDAFLTLAQSPGGLSCFLVPRWRPDGSRNRFFIQRLKDKLGNRANASSEIEYDGAWARMVGEEGRGVPTIIEMVHHTRLDVAICSAALMRQALAQAVHHAAHRTAFQRRLIDQPLMRNVLADLTVESEAATILVMRLARAFDQAAGDPAEQAFARLATAVAKFWVSKRAPDFVFEAMECHGGNGYVEESILPRLYREAPLSSIWEGCGNVISLDILRALRQNPESLEAFFAELELATGADARLDAMAERIRAMLKDTATLELGGRRLAEAMALALQGALLVRHGEPRVAEAFCRSRLEAGRGATYGTLPADLPFAELIERARPSFP